MLYKWKSLLITGYFVITRKKNLVILKKELVITRKSLLLTKKSTVFTRKDLVSRVSQFLLYIKYNCGYTVILADYCKPMNTNKQNTE